MPTFSTILFDKFISLTLPPLALNARVRQILLILALAALGLVIAWLPLVPLILLMGGITFLGLLLTKPIVGLYALIPLIPFSPLFSISLGGASVGLMEIMLLLTIIAWLLQLASGHAPSFSVGRANILLWPFLLFLGGVSLSWLTALSLGASLVETIKWLEMVVLYLFIVAVLPARQIKWVVAMLLLTGLAQAALGLYQFIFKVGPEGFLLFGGRFLRAYGTFAQPNPYAGYLGLVLPLSLAVALWGISHSRNFTWPIAGIGSTFQSKLGMLASRTVVAILFSLPLVFLLMALFASQSRGAWLGFAVAGAVTFTLYNKRTAVLMTTLILVSASILLVGTFDLSLLRFNSADSVVTQRLAEAFSIFTISDVTAIEVTDANFATIERLAHWQAAREMWRDNLWLGMGFGNYAVVYPAYAVGRWLNPLGHAHNYLLNIGAEAGLVGITVYLIFWIFTFIVLWLTIQRSHGFERAIAVGALGVMVHLHVHNLFDNLYVQGMYLHIAVILALISIIYRHCAIQQIPWNSH